VPAEYLQDRLGYHFAEPNLLRTALTHRSAVAEGLATESYERLEFLGDAVLDLVVAEMLYRSQPGLAEGQMAKIRAAVVGEPALAEIARDAGVGPALILGIGEERSGGRDKPSILSDVVESLLGAAYIEAGFDEVARLVRRLWEPRVARRLDHPGKSDYKSRLQEVVAAMSGGRPEYTSRGSGPDHAKVFTAIVTVDGRELGSGMGSSKKKAEQEAARRALEILESA
jgi:ribonuclease-3